MTAAKQVRAQYTQEFKLEAVRQVSAGQAIAVVAKVLGIPKASLGNWVRQAARGIERRRGRACWRSAPAVTSTGCAVRRTSLAGPAGATAMKLCWHTSAPSTPRSRGNTAGLGCTRNCWPGASGWARIGCAS
ncbi:hypothetical protein B0E41_21680 [Hydrogenophaga sp. A37]|nr:hypothetical protein B0E41_21680 [Hydrogenophaga sp. A37]